MRISSWRMAVATACAVVAGVVVPGSALPVSAQESATPPTVTPYVPVSGIPCYDDNGPRVSVFYLYAEGQPDDLAARLPAIRDAAAQVDAVVDASARRTGGTRHVRFRTSTDCSLVVRSAAVPKADVKANLAQLTAAGLLPAGDNALVFAGPTLGTFAGDATRPEDDQPGAANLSNAGGHLAAVGFAFWGSVDGPASMLARALGAVQPGAPHASAAGGCTDGEDPLCYDDLAIPEPLTSPCSALGRYLLDCGNDDYFSTAPTAGSWLAEHWNVADSVFLTAAAPTRVDAVEPFTVEIEGVPGNGRVGPQTPLTVRVTSSQPLQKAVLVSDRSPGVQPLALSGQETATGSLRSLSSYGAGTLVAIATDKLGRERLSAAHTVTYVRGAELTLGTPAAALRGVVPWTVDLDLSGDQLTASRFLVFKPATATAEPVVLVDQQTTAGTTRYEGTIDTTKLPDGDSTQLVLVLADDKGAPIAGSQTSLRRSVSNTRPQLALGVAPDAVLLRSTTLTATVTDPVASVRYTQTTGDCAAGRTIGQATSAPFSVSYDSAADWRGPDSRWGLCATAVLADGSTTTVGPVRVSTTQPDSVELHLLSGSRLTVGMNKLPVVVRAPSNRRLRALQLFETNRVFGKPGGLVLTQPVPEGTLPTTVDLLVPPGALGTTELYVRAVFADGPGEYLRSGSVTVTGVAGPAPTMTLSAGTILVGGKVLVTGTAPPGAQLRLYGVVRPATAFTLLRYGAVPADGKFSAVLAPAGGMRIYAEVLGGGRTAQLPLNVRSTSSFVATRTGVRTYRLAGTVAPKRAGMTVTLARRTATGGVAFVRARTGADGRWAVSYRFPVNGAFDLFAVVSPDPINAQGQSPVRRVAVS